MIYVVLDTNVLVSALWSKDGTPARIAHLIPSGKIIPCFCDEILHEYKVVLSRPKFNFPQHQITTLLDNIKQLGRSYIANKSNFHMIDESDRIFMILQGKAKRFLSAEILNTSQPNLL